MDEPGWEWEQELIERQAMETAMNAQSEQINELATALAKAQGKITGARKDSDNPFFKSKYADLASVWDACRQALSDNGLAVIQTTEANGEGVTVVTTLAHSSGQWVRGVLHMTPKDSSPQGVGSAITYARRYALAAIVGVAQVDDDAEAAHGRWNHNPRDGLGDADPEVADEYADAMLTALDGNDTARVRELHRELNGDPAMYAAAADRAQARRKKFKTDWRAIVSAKEAA